MPDVAEIEDLSSRAFAEWMAYASIEPFGEERADVRAGIIACVIANVNRDRKKKPEPFTPQDFMPFLERATPEPLSPDQLTDIAKQMFGHPGAAKAKKKGMRG